MAKKRTEAPTSWPATRPVMTPIDQIHPYPNNARTHPPEQITMLAGIMKRRGVDQPIVVDEDGVILKGHGRRLAAIAAGFEEYPVVVHYGVPEADKKAMRLEDNQVALLAGWDNKLLGTEVTGLRLAGYDVKLLGFADATLRRFDPPQPEANTVPEPTKTPTVRRGDVWHLGNHLVACADATDPETWKTLFGKERAAMGFTDPPYGVSYQADGFAIIEGDRKRRDELYLMLVQSLRQLTARIVDVGAIYIWHASVTREDFAQAMKAVGLVERQYLMWVKPSVAFGRADYQWQHEPCFYASKGERAPAFYGPRTESTVWHVELASAKDTAVTVGNGLILLDGEGGTLYVQARAPKGKKVRQVRIVKDGNVYLSAEQPQSTVWEVARDSGYEHPTQKPVELARRAIENSSHPGEIVADAFLGSGTTLIGAEMTGRRCYGAEIDPRYAEVIVRRWEKLTGRKATLDGKTIEQVAKARRKGRALVDA